MRADAELAKFTNASDLGNFLAEGSEAHAAFVERLFKDTIKQPIMAYGANEKARLRQFFSDNGCNIRKLLGEIVVSATLANAVDPATKTPDVKASAK
jgi:hypothetical protein